MVACEAVILCRLLTFLSLNKTAGEDSEPPQPQDRGMLLNNVYKDFSRMAAFYCGTMQKANLPGMRLNGV